MTTEQQNLKPHKQIASTVAQDDGVSATGSSCNEVEAASGQLVYEPKGTGDVATSATVSSQVVVTGTAKKTVAELKPHPLNKSLYGDALETDFVEAIRRNGIFHPLLVTHTHLIISGNRRYAAAIQLGMTEVPVVYFESDDELDIQTALVEANRQREKSNEQKGREFNLLVEVESKRAALRMATKKQSEAGKAVTHAEKGKARDLVAEKIGAISGVSAQRAGKVAEAIDKLAKKKHGKKEEELRNALNKNIEKAFKLAIELGEIPSSVSKSPRASKASTSPIKPAVSKAVEGNSGSSKESVTPEMAVVQAADFDSKEAKPEKVGHLGHGDLTHDDGIEAADKAVSFLRSRDAAKLTDQQKSDWKKIGDQIATWLMKLGVKISAA